MGNGRMPDKQSVARPHRTCGRATLCGVQGSHDRPSREITSATAVTLPHGHCTRHSGQRVPS